MAVDLRADHERDGVVLGEEKLLAALIMQLIRLFFDADYLLG